MDNPRYRSFMQSLMAPALMARKEPHFFVVPKRGVTFQPHNILFSLVIRSPNTAICRTMTNIP
jgi:hypothetical protein